MSAVWDHQHETQSADAGHPFHFGSWNVNGQGGRAVDAHLRLLDSVGCQIVALQEVTEDYFRELKRHPRVKHAVHSLEIQPPAADSPRNRRLGCAVISLGPDLEIKNASLIGTHVCPERALVAGLTVLDSHIFVGSFHSPNGSQWGTAKALWFKSITDWLCEQRGATIFGIDANTPKREGLLDTDAHKWWNEDSHPTIGNAGRDLVGDAPRHDLADVWKTLHPTIKEFPVSYNRDNRREKRSAFACRYDFIFASSHVTPTTCAYHYDTTVGVAPRLSDHALVTASLRL